MSVPVPVSCPTLPPKGAAQYLGVREQTLAVWRSTGRYQLPFTRVGRLIRYRVADLEKFLELHTVGEFSE
ncbi:MAG: helix-turn-helix domain-containing protein [Pirellulales bacterium]|nr:helix-turn-helix domain-containing protein [Pirellulales bacterium]